MVLVVVETNGTSGSPILERIRRALDGSVLVVAGLLSVSLTYAAWHDVSWGYDIWYYHLPFAARLVGIIDDGSYSFSAANQARFEGFPLLVEALQGIAWRLTNRVSGTNLVALASLFGLVGYLWRRANVPPHLALVALFAIPIVHIHATSSYVDLPANVFVTVLALEVGRLLTSREAASLRHLVVAFGLAAAAVNAKFQLVPIVAILVAVLVATTLQRSWRQSRRRVVRTLALSSVCLPIVVATPLKNALVHKNPVWPVEVSVLGRSLPHTEEAYAQSPPALAHSPRFIRFFRSALEIDNAPLDSHSRWSIDQWAPPDDPSCRMGGYFGAYVVVNLVAFVASVARTRRRRATQVAAAMLGGVTLVAANMPQSHELRYYMHWMLLLVSSNLILYSQSVRGRTGASLVASATLAVVVWSTGGGYVWASGNTFEELLEKKRDHLVIDSATPGERLCISREPFTFLYAPAFQRRRDFTVQEATTPSDCRSARLIP